MASVRRTKFRATVRIIALLAVSIPSPELGVALMAGYSVMNAGFFLEERMGAAQAQARSAAIRQLLDRRTAGN